MKQILKVKTDPKSKECYLDLKDFSQMVDITKVKHYTLEPVIDLATDKVVGLSLKFYDEKEKLLPVTTK